MLPFEKLFGNVLDYVSLRMFGPTCFVLQPQIKRDKFSPNSALCVYLGYGMSQKGYYCFDLVSHKLYVSRHVVFLEHIHFFYVLASSHHLT